MKNIIPALVILITACCIASSCTSRNNIEQIDSKSLAHADSLIVELGKRKDTIEKLAEPKVDTSSILLQMSLRRIEFIMAAKDAELKAWQAKSEYYTTGRDTDYKKAKKAIKEYNSAFNRYDSLDKAIRKIYLAYNKKEMPQPTKYY